VTQTAAQGSAFARLLDTLNDQGRATHTRGHGQASAQCPSHDDRNDSLSITANEKGVLVRCHAGCDVRDVVTALGLKMGDLFDAPREKKAGWSVVAEYPYRDETGRVLYVKERRWPKDFRQYRIENGQKLYSLGDVRRVLYRLPELLASAEVDAAVYVCEGEKDADRVRSLGATATTWGDGAWQEDNKPKWRREYTETLRGRDVVIVADDDAPGRHTAVTIARLLDGTARSVQVVLPAVGKDAHDHLEAGKTLGEFRPLTQTPQSPQATQKPTTATPGTTFLGMREDGHAQLRMAERFAYMHSGRMMHVTGLGWHAWDGTRWALDEDGAADRAVIAVLKESLHELAHREDPGFRKNLLKDVTKSETAGGIAGVLRVAQSLPGMTCTVKSLDTDPWLLNTPDGTVDLRAGTMSPHNPEDRCTKVTSVGFGNQGDAVVFRAFLERVLPDIEVREFVQRLLGYSLLGEVREHVLPIWVGDGANGKGTLRDLIRYVVGDYGIEVDPSILMAGPEKHSTERMDLLGARFVACSETARGAGLNEAVMKRLVGGDPIRARRMRQDNVEFEPSHTLVMMTNHLPRVSGDDGGVWRRILVVPFDVVIPEHERDPQLRDKLRAEAPAVMSWLWDGWLAYQEQGLNPPASVRARTDQYQADSDALGRFLDERCLSGPHFHAPAQELYTEFTRWCTDAGEQYGSAKEFAEMLRKKGIAKRHTRTGNVYDGIGLAAPDDDEPDEPQEPEQTSFL
jgi:putative DNA primase/helicase